MSDLLNELKSKQTIKDFTDFLNDASLTPDIGTFGGRKFVKYAKENEGSISLNDIVKQFAKIKNSSKEERSNAAQIIVSLDKKADELLKSVLLHTDHPKLLNVMTKIRQFFGNLFYDRNKILIQELVFQSKEQRPAVAGVGTQTESVKQEEEITVETEASKRRAKFRDQLEKEDKNWTLGWYKYQWTVMRPAITENGDNFTIDYQKLKEMMNEYKNEDFFNPMDPTTSPLRPKPKLRYQLVWYVKRSIKEKLDKLSDAEKEKFVLKLRFINVAEKDKEKVGILLEELSKAKLEYIQIERSAMIKESTFWSRFGRRT